MTNEQFAEFMAAMRGIEAALTVISEELIDINENLDSIVGEGVSRAMRVLDVGRNG
jgi:hypothetical protein